MPHRTTYVTVAEVADAYNAAAREAGAKTIHVRTVRRECREGRLPAEQRGGVWLIREADAARWLASYERHGRKNGAAVTATAAP